MTANQNEIQKYILEFVQTEFKKTIEAGSDPNLLALLDSLDLINLLFHLEDKYNVEIPDKLLEVRDSLSTNNLTALITDQLK